MYQVGVKKLHKDATGKWHQMYLWSERYNSLESLMGAINQNPEAFINKDIRIVSVR